MTNMAMFKRGVDFCVVSLFLGLEIFLSPVSAAEVLSPSDISVIAVSNVIQNSTSPESRLASVSGRERIALLLELLVANRDRAPKETLKYGHQALELLNTHPDASIKITVLSNMAWASMVIGLYEDGVEYGERAVKIAERTKNPAELVVPLNIVGLLYWRQTKLEQALSFYFRALDIAINQGNKSGEAATYNNIGLIYHDRGDNVKALEYFSKAKRIHQLSDKPEKLTTYLNNIAGIYLAQEEYSEALELQLRVLKIREELEDLPGIAEIQLNIGITYDHIGDYPNALEMFAKAVKLFEKFGDRRAVSQCLNAIGLTYHHLREYERADSHFKKALIIAKEIGDESIIADTLMSLTELNIEQEQPVTARSYLETGLRIAVELKLKPLEITGRYHQANIYLQQQKLADALTQAHMAIALAEELNQRPRISEGHKLLSRIYVAIGDFQNALSAYQEYTELEKSIISRTNSDKLAQLRSLHDMEAKVKQIKLLEQDKALQAAEIEQQYVERNIWILGLLALLLISILLYGRISQTRLNKSLNKSVRIQKELLQAVAHEFRAPLARVQLAFDMLINNNDNYETPDPLRDKIESGLNELDGLLKEVLQFIRMQNPKVSLDYSEVNIQKLLAEIMEDQINLYPNKEFAIQCLAEQYPKIKVDQQQFIRAISNLLRNAARFSDKQVQISYQCTEKQFTIYVDDDGPGIPATQRIKVFQPFTRLDPSRSRDSGGLGLGLAIVKSISTRHKGDVSVEESPLGGARFILRWPNISK